MQIQRDYPIPAAVGLTHVKEVLRIDHSHDDAALDGYVAAVTTELCQRAGLALRHEVVTAFADDWADCVALSLPIRPVMADQVGKVTVMLGAVDITGKVTLMHGDRPKVTLKDGHGLSVAHLSQPVVLTYVAGFGADIGDVPANYQTAIAHQVGYAFDAEDTLPNSRRHAPLFASLLGTQTRVGI